MYTKLPNQSLKNTNSSPNPKSDFKISFLTSQYSPEGDGLLLAVVQG